MRIGYQEQAVIAGAALLAFALLVAGLLNQGNTWWTARSELMHVARQVDLRSKQVRAERVALELDGAQIDPASFLDTPMPPNTTVSILEAETGRSLASNGALPRSLELAAWKAGRGSFTMDDYLVAVSKSHDGRTLEVAARPLAAVRAAADKTRSRYLSAGAVAGLGLALLSALAIRHRRSLSYELREAVKHRLLHVAMQPIVGFEPSGMRVVGFECLARWQTASGEEIPPSRFVPMVEAAGLGPELARCMVANIAREFGATLVANPQLYVAFNLSSADVASPELLDDIERTLAAASIPAAQIVIELTERTFESEGVELGLDRLRKAGHRLCVDDFGTGASDASRLASFRAEMVKVDRSVLAHAAGKGKAASLLPQLVKMAHACGAKVVIEGVETKAQAKGLAEFGEVFAQGFYWHLPMDAGEATRLVEEERKLRGLLQQAPRPDAAAHLG